MAELPVLNINEFLPVSGEFYINDLLTHLKEHHFIHHPHKHDFYLCVVFLKGKGIHEVDFRRYRVKPGCIFFLKPGQVHNWKLSPETDGFIFFHSRSFYDLHFQSRHIDDLPFYNSHYNVPVISASPKKLEEIGMLLTMMMKEFRAVENVSMTKLCSLMDAVYTDLSRLYVAGHKKEEMNTGYLLKLRKLEKLIDLHYREIKSPAEYASMLSISGKHLNRIVKESLNKTVTEMIADRILLEAKRRLVHREQTVSQIADWLGYSDHAYFNRLFRKHVGMTPLQFVEDYLTT